MINKLGKQFAVVFCMVLSLHSPQAVSALITEVWDVRITQAPGRYGNIAAGKVFQLTSTYETTGTWMDSFDVGRWCLEASPAVDLMCDVTNLIEARFSVLSNAINSLPMLFDIDKAIADGNIIDTTRYLPSSVYYINNVHDNRIAGFDSSVFYEGYFNEYRNDYQFKAALRYENTWGRNINQTYFGSMRRAERVILIPDAPPAPVEPPVEEEIIPVVNPPVVVEVSEPVSLALFSFGLLGLACMRRKKKSPSV